MDRTARILATWIVGCLLTGGALIVANVPIAEQAWTDQAAALVRLGLAVAMLGLVGLVAEVVVVINSFRRIPERTTSESAQLTPAAPKVETTPPGRLAELEERDRRLRVGHLLNQMSQAFTTAGDLVHNHGPGGAEGVDLGWARINEWDGYVERILSDPDWPKPEDLAVWRRDIGSMLSDISGPERLARYVTVKREALQKIHDNVHVAYR